MKKPFELNHYGSSSIERCCRFAVSLTGEKTEFLGQAPRKLHENSIVTFQ
jgi:hypothetical protein